MSAFLGGRPETPKGHDSRTMPEAYDGVRRNLERPDLTMDMKVECWLVDTAKLPLG